MDTILKNISKIRVVVDIETLGRNPGCVITEIAASACDQDFQEIEAFAEHLEVDTQVMLGMEICEEAHKWRNDNNLPYRLFDAHNPLEVLSAFGCWLRKLAYENEIDVSRFEFWCQGTDFDRPCIDALYTSLNSTPPWKYYQWNDCRTACNLAGVKRQGAVMHTALADARQQANVMKLVLNRVKNVSIGGKVAVA